MTGWTPGTPWRPALPYHVQDAMRAANTPEAIAQRIACDQREAQEEADGLACPVDGCGAGIGKRCFGPEARSNHPQRGAAHWSARTMARNEGRL